MANTPTDPDEIELLKQIEQVRRRLADMRVKQDLSPYQAMPDKIILSSPETPYYSAVATILKTEERHSPDPKLHPKTPSPKRRR